MSFREIAPFIIIESNRGSVELTGSRISSDSYANNSWSALPAVTAELSKLIRSKTIYFSLTQSPGYVHLSVITNAPSLSQYSPECIISSLAKLPYLCFKDIDVGLVVCLNVVPLEIRPKKTNKRSVQKVYV